MAIRDFPTTVELPQIASSALASSSFTGTGVALTNQSDLGVGLVYTPLTTVGTGRGWPIPDFMRRFEPFAQPAPEPKKPTIPKAEEKKLAEDRTFRRLVQVFIADPDPKVPLDRSLLYSGDQQLTDLTDQELFFDIDISGILKKHNELRVTLVDKSVKNRTQNLEPVRIRDLRMTVVTIASF